MSERVSTAMGAACLLAAGLEHARREARRVGAASLCVGKCSPRAPTERIIELMLTLDSSATTVTFPCSFFLFFQVLKFSVVFGRFLLKNVASKSGDCENYQTSKFLKI